MALPHVFIWWDEFDRRDLPCVCMRCGKKKAEWTKWRFERSVYKNMRNYRRIRKVEIPLCTEHAGLFGFAMITCVTYDDDRGVWAINVCDEYQEALKKYRKSEVKAWKEENPDEDPDEGEDTDLPPGLRKAPEEPKQSTTGLKIGLAFFLVILAVVLGGFVLVCGLVGVLFFAVRAR
ncbi:MAG: hypothetical protein HYX68_27450 [Planctomycetes bacterium]|nr:hypothetical protein [Planctomycetota bacterium]